jgi:hypothetical protein
LGSNIVLGNSGTYELLRIFSQDIIERSSQTSIKEFAMWVILMPQPGPDAAYWPGRRFFGALDAAVWPLLWVWLIAHAPVPVGVVGPVVAAVAVLCGLQRLHRAVFINHRYRFTTWRWGKRVGALLEIGLMLKLMLRP